MPRTKVKVTSAAPLALPTPPGPYEWYALAADSMQQHRTGPFRGCQGVVSGVVRQFYTGEKISVCCLVLRKFYRKKNKRSLRYFVRPVDQQLNLTTPKENGSVFIIPKALTVQ